MTEHLTSEEGLEVSVVELEKTFVFRVGGQEFSLSKEKANGLANVLHGGTYGPVLDSEFFYH